MCFGEVFTLTIPWTGNGTCIRVTHSKESYRLFSLKSLYISKSLMMHKLEDLYRYKGKFVCNILVCMYSVQSLSVYDYNRCTSGLTSVILLP